MLFYELEGEDVGNEAAMKSGSDLWILIVHLISVTSFSD